MAIGTAGLISWTPTAAGPVEVTVRVSNGVAPGGVLRRLCGRRGLHACRVLCGR
ncbi:hypothetical protein [Archangium violaceum]|uniref:hypothetical protein n=1 Tax=Archangium violaceum TaxID=83451 RepID=UPI0036DAB197